MISVVIAAYNEEKLLPATLEAINTACAKVNKCEVIVVDNESTNRTAEIAASAGAKVISETIHNIAMVRNRGAEKAIGNLVVFIDADTICATDALRTHRRSNVRSQMFWRLRPR